MAFKPDRMKKLREQFPARRPELFRAMFADTQKNEFSQQDLANVMGLAQQHISRYERGERIPDSTMLEKIADALKTSTDYLLGRTDNPSELAYSDMTETERATIASMRSGDINSDALLLAQKLSKFPDSIRNKILGIARDLQK